MSDAPSPNFANIRFVFLDRDGVINREPPGSGYITRCDELVLLPGAAEAIAALNRSQRKAIIVTNQRGIALGLFSSHDLQMLHAHLREALAAKSAQLDAIYVCPHDIGTCSCRKPLTGLFEQAFLDFPGARPENSVMVGDSLRDIEAGARLGMATVFVTSGESSPSDEPAARLAQLSASSLAEFVQKYLG